MKRFLMIIVLVVVLMLSPAIKYIPREFFSNRAVQARVSGPRNDGKLTQQQQYAIEKISGQLSEVHLNKSGVPNWISGNLGQVNGEPRVAAVEVIDKLKLALGATDDDSFEALSVTSDKLGQTHIRMQQRYRGLRVIGGDMIVHLKDGNAIGINGNFHADIDLEIEPGLSADEAINSSIARIGSDSKKLSLPELVIYFARENEARLAWNQLVAYQNGANQLDIIYADAQTGELLGQNSQIMSANVRNIYDGNQIGNPFCIYASAPQIFPPFTDAFEISTYQNLAKVYQYYFNVFGRDSFDGKGGAMNATVHEKKSINCDDKNVFTWTNPSSLISASPAYTGGVLSAGDGDGILYDNPAADITLMAHEFTHGVIGTSAHLENFREPGALSESFADAMAVSAERFLTGSTKYEIGAVSYKPNIPGKAVRYMYFPPADGGQFTDPLDTALPTFVINPASPLLSLASVDYYPNLLTTNNNCDSSNDQCYVHFNSGIGNYAFYLLAHGGTHHISNIFVPGIGIDKASQIWYRALTTYLVTESGFSEARDATMHAASDLYGFCSPEATSVEKTWDAVGVPRDYAPLFGNLTCDENIISDSSFESGYFEGSASRPFQHWITYPLSGSGNDSSEFFLPGALPAPFNTAKTHSGVVRAVLGNVYASGGFGSLPQAFYQDVTIPTGMTKASLNLYLKIDTINNTTTADAMNVEIRDLNDNLLSTVATYTNKDPQANSGNYSKRAYDVTPTLLPYKGNKLRIKFYLFRDRFDPYTGSSGPNFETLFNIDDVAIAIQ